jgi:transposase-like protein
MKKSGKQSRIFSEAFKREKVKLLDQGKMKVADICKIYNVSNVSVYLWRKKFSSVLKDERVVVEKISEAKKTIELYNQVKNLEQALGRKQMELDYFKKVVELASEEKGEDLEKKYKPKQ